jgi:phenylacetate-CoA ligase
MATKIDSMNLFDAKMETLSPEELSEHQLERVKKLVEWVYGQTEFFRNRLQDAGVTPDDIKTWDDFRNRIPFINKKDLVEDQAKNPPFGTRLCVPRKELRGTHITSGSSGQGQEVYGLTQNDLMYCGKGYGASLKSMGARKGDLVASFFPIATMAGGLASIEGLKAIEVNPMYLAFFDTKSKIEHLVKYNPDCLMATPAYLSRITVVCEEMGIDPRKDISNLRNIVLSTENFPPQWAREMQKIWGAAVQDCYGSSQIGTNYGYTCSQGSAPEGREGFYHLSDHLVLVEVLNPETNEPVQYGEEGEPVVSTFGREASPLLRFRSSDKVRLLPPEPCDCGRTSRRWEIGNIARYDDMIKMKGINVWPAAVSDVLFSFPEIDEYNGRVYIDEKGSEHVKVTFEFKQSVTDEELKKHIVSGLRGKMRDKVGLNFEFEAAPFGTIERFEYKTRRWTDERKEGLKQVKFLEK